MKWSFVFSVSAISHTKQGVLGMLGIHKQDVEGKHYGISGNQHVTGLCE